MSIPANPLDRFRSYAYHHILLIANSTEVFRNFVNPPASDTEAGSSSLSGLKIGEKNMVGNAGFYVICDTRKNSYFTISELSYTSAPTVGNSKYANIIMSSIDVTIIDTTGIALLNYLNWICNSELDISLYKASFLLKTIFVGHTYDGKTETVYQDSIPMVLMSLNVNPSSHGAVAQAKFSPIENGAGVYAGDYSRLFDIPGIKSETNLLKDAVKSFESQLNQKSREWYRSLQLKIVDNDKTTEESPAKGYGKLVQYMFTIPDDWADFKVNGVVDGAVETSFKKNSDKKTDTKGVYIGLHTSPKSNILEVLELLMKQSNEVQELASNKNREDGFLRGYRILPSITSDDDTITVHYDVVNFCIPKPAENSAKKEGQDEVKKTLAEQFQIDDSKNVMFFDYIFTGKNTDILDFQMKINDVQIYLADNIMIGPESSQEVKKDQKDKTSDEANTKPKEAVLKIRRGDPITPPMKTGSQYQNMSYITEADAKKDAVKARQQFIHNMSLAHGIASLNAILKIRGNPDLYGRFTDSNIMPHVKIIDNINDVKYVTKDDKFVNGVDGKYLLENDVKTYLDARNARIEALGAKGTSAPTLTPFYIKIKIMGQNFDINDKSENAFSSFKPFEQFWYDGYYQVNKIEHRFVNGEFYQDLLIGSIPLDLYGQTQPDKSKQDNPDTTKQDAEKEKEKENAETKTQEAPSQTPAVADPQASTIKWSDVKPPSAPGVGQAGTMVQNIAIPRSRR